MFRVFYLCYILLPLAVPVFGYNINNVTTARRELYEKYSCEYDIKIGELFDIADIVYTSFFMCLDECRRVEVPSITDVNNMGKMLVVNNTQKYNNIVVIGENGNEIITVGPQNVATITFENGWNLITEKDADAIISEENRVWSLVNQNKLLSQFFSWRSYRGLDFFKGNAAYEVEIICGHLLNKYFLFPLNAKGENALLKFSNLSPDVVNLELKNKQSIEVDKGHSLYLKYSNGWNGVIEKKKN